MERLLRTRRRALPPGWFPDDPGEIAALVGEWTKGLAVPDARAAISPHAGWAFSGRLAAAAVASLAKCDTIAVIAGHLGRNSPILAAGEDAFETVGGLLEADVELLAILGEELTEAGIPAPSPDLAADNGVEVLLPLVAAIAPGTKVLWLRCPPNHTARELGSALERAAGRAGRALACLGSTDLTHYGPAYGFEPMGRGARAEAWAREVNDAAIVDSLVGMDPSGAMTAATERYAACSGGAAVAALCFAIEAGATEGILLGRASSLDVHRDASFVGYCAVAYR